MRRGDSGFYSYGIFERLNGWPQIDVDQIRIAYKLLGDKLVLFFNLLIISPSFVNQKNKRKFIYLIFGTVINGQISLHGGIGR